MSISLTLDQTTRIVNSDTEPDVYVVENYIVGATHISMKVFVYKTNTQAYSHIATTSDLMNYPESIDDAMAQNFEYYREDFVNREFTSVYLARDFATVVRQRLNALVEDTARIAASFNVGKQTYTYTAGG